MTKPHLFGDVAAFHQRFNQDYTGPTRHLPEDIQNFRHKFHNEEALEYLSAVAYGHAAEALDAIVDQIYVLLGTAYLMGADFDEAWRRVHAKNMEKIPAADGTLKIRKPDGWTPPDLTDLVPADLEPQGSQHYKAWLGVLGAEARRRAITLPQIPHLSQTHVEAAFAANLSPFDVLDDNLP